MSTEGFIPKLTYLSQSLKYVYLQAHRVPKHPLSGFEGDLRPTVS
jgi:hypothetical protein